VRGVLATRKFGRGGEIMGGKGSVGEGGEFVSPFFQRKETPPKKGGIQGGKQLSGFSEQQEV